MKKLTNPHLDKWLTTYKKAWETLDPTLIITLFSDNTFYFETPFHLPITNTSALYDYWAFAPTYQTQVNFYYEIIGIKGMRGFCKWKSVFFQFTTNEMVSMDGIFEIKFNEEGVCSVFREWWHKKVEPAAYAAS